MSVGQSGRGDGATIVASRVLPAFHREVIARPDRRMAADEWSGKGLFLSLRRNPRSPTSTLWSNRLPDPPRQPVPPVELLGHAAHREDGDVPGRDDAQRAPL